MKQIQEVKMNKRTYNLYLILIIFLFTLNMNVNAQDEPLGLSGAIEKTLENNYGIIISKSGVNIASINNSWGTAGRYPTIGFTANSGNSYEVYDSITSNRLSFGIALNWTLFNGFKVNISKNKLENLENLAQGRSAVIIENAIQDVTMAYYNILLQKEKLEVLKKVMQLSKDRFNYEMAKKELGGSVTYNVLQAKNIYLEDKAAMLNQEVTLKNAIRNLNFLIKESPSAQWNMTDEFASDTSEYILSDLMEKMVANNQTLKNQYINLQLQQQEIQLQKTALYPKLALSAGVDNSYAWRKAGGNTTSSELLEPYGNLSLTYNIFTAGNRKSAIDIAKINQEISQVETEEIKHSLTNQLFNEFDIYNLRKTLLNISNESLEAAELNLQIANEKFKSGTINSFNYRDIQLIYLNSALNKLQSVYNLVYSNTILARLTGGFVQENK